MNKQQLVDAESIVFVDSLVMAMTGLSLEQIPDENKNIINNCIDIFEKSIESYVLENHGEKRHAQLMSVGHYPTTDWGNFSGLKEVYDEAYDNFLNNLATK